MEYKSYKTEINPTEEQKLLINSYIGCARFLYNQMVAKNKEQYELFKKGESEKSFWSSAEFNKYVNHVLSKQDGFEWIKKCPSKTRKKALDNAERAYKEFFKGRSRYPKFKKKKDQNTKMYLSKGNKRDIEVQRHRIKVPKLKWIRLKEKGYFPLGNPISCTISKKVDRYYISVTYYAEKEDYQQKYKLNKDGIGIDLGLKDFAICSNGITYKNINKNNNIKKLEKQLKKEQRVLNNKYKLNKQGNKYIKTKNIEKQIIKIQKLQSKLTNIRTDYIRKVASEIVKNKPSYITIENLDIKSMMKNKHLAKSIQSQKFYEFFEWLKNNCSRYGIELRKVSKFYPSSKLCSCCGYKKVKLKLSDRIYECENCGEKIDRDLNASLNLLNAKEYTVVT